MISNLNRAQNELSAQKGPKKRVPTGPIFLGLKSLALKESV